MEKIHLPGVIAGFPKVRQGPSWMSSQDPLFLSHSPAAIPKWLWNIFSFIDLFICRCYHGRFLSGHLQSGSHLTAKTFFLKQTLVHFLFQLEFPGGALAFRVTLSPCACALPFPLHMQVPSSGPVLGLSSSSSSSFKTHIRLTSLVN